jgi:hydrophobic/amphiphilic exporter-1 (mainly G- bacteria), HAE1 family
MWFTRVSISHPVFATMLMLALMVLGLFSSQRLTVEELPDVKFPVVVVNTTYPGASPEIVESDVSRKVEEAISAVSGLKNLYSFSYEGLSVVVAEFVLTVNPEVAVQDVREKVAAVKRAFRKEVDEPTISRFNPDERPIVSVALTSDTVSLRDLTTRADHYVQKQYQTIKGVGNVTLVGGTKREVQVLLKPEAMYTLGVGADQVVAALKAENQELPAGSLVVRGGEQLVQIQGRLPTPAAFERLIVTQRNGQPIYLGQLATIRDGEAERESVALVNGQTALTLDIIKVQGGNTIEVADLVRAKTAQLAGELALEGIRVTTLNDGSTGVRRSLSGVRENLLEGAALTVAIVFLFLGSWRSTVITGLTLPVALVGTLFFIYLAGFTVNVMTLMALSLCVGLLVDDAIVVRENIVRHAAMGKSAHQSALDGTGEIGLAVFATTMSIVAVFVPVGFMGGIIGKFFYQFGLTVTAAVLISMFVSFTLDPMLSSVWRDPHAHGRKHGGWVGPLLDWFEAWMDGMVEFYTRVIRWALGHRKSVLLIAAASLLGAFALVLVVGGEFVPEPDLSRLRVRFDVAEGAALDYSEAKARQVETALREFPEVVETYASVNVGGSLGKNAAVIDLRLTPRAERSRTQKQLVPLLRERLARIAGIRLKAIIVPDGPGGGEKPIYLSIQGGDFAELKRIAAQVTEKLARIRGLADVDLSLKEAKPTLDVRLNRELAAQAGLSVERIGLALRPLIAGDAATTWKAPDGENYDVRVRLAPGERETAADLVALHFAGSTDPATGRPRMIPLAQVAEVRATLGPTQINRRALAREIALTAGLAGRPLAEVSGEIAAALKDIPLPPGYRFDLGGASKDMAESGGYAVSALLLAVVFIYMVLASQFGSFVQPLAIMSSLPLSLIGVMAALFVAGSTLNIFSIIGVIMLMGLVTKNAILLVDFVNHLRGGGMERAAAIVEAGRVRLRPILMTTFAMVAGMAPLVLTSSEGAEQRAPMAHAIIGGVITSTLLTLIVVPVVFTYLDDWAARVGRRLARERSRLG